MKTSKILHLAIHINFTMALSVHADPANSEEHSDQVVSRIAFASCNNPREGITPMYDAVLEHDPEIFVFLGDNIYGDTEDMDVLRKKYAELEAQEGFQRLRKATTMLATWDDHDYGVNDGGNTRCERSPS